MISGTSEGPPENGVPRLIPFGGGKGGVGKTFVAANLATTLAKAGHRVVAVDGDLEGANLHTALGVARPRYSVAEFAAEREEDVRKLLEDTPFPNLRLIAATRPNLANPQPSHALRVRFVRALRTLPADFVFIDLGAGADATVMDYFMVCDDGVVVIAPEPTSVENAYAFMRAAFYRRLKLAMLFISHDLRVVERMSSRVVIMDAGHVVEEGLTSTVLSRPRSVTTRLLLEAAGRPTDVSAST